jgi:hypothetical protein
MLQAVGITSPLPQRSRIIAITNQQGYERGRVLHVADAQHSVSGMPGNLGLDSQQTTVRGGMQA